MKNIFFKQKSQTKENKYKILFLDKYSPFFSWAGLGFSFVTSGAECNSENGFSCCVEKLITNNDGLYLHYLFWQELARLQVLKRKNIK